MITCKQEHASDAFPGWDSINWDLIERKVRSVQVRIVKAKKAGKHRRLNLCSGYWHTLGTLNY